ncbi:MAG TPA: ABC transporter ATP-binding protein [Stellaceae bacterium]|jgi:iron(III) transport system ATP-binding protein|nr:ABC transporter ATP-binding protein [Stellaceae bacterium]
MSKPDRADAAMTAPEGAAAPLIQVRNLAAAYGTRTVIENLSFTVYEGEHVSLLGPSGCGKTTMLRCIAGLETPIAGDITIGAETVFSVTRRTNMPPERRGLSMVFQSYAIWPHMTVFENVAYGLRSRGLRGAAVREKVEQALQTVGMSEYIDRSATALSGGQQQRVAFARSYATTPRAMLLDEPLSNLDARMRAQMRDELKDLQRASNLATVYVTHDQEEAMAMSDRIIVMREGRIEQVGAPLEIYNQPRSRFVADFIGAANIVSGRLAPGSDEAGPVLAVGDVSLRCAPCARLPRPREDGQHLAAIRTVYPEIRREPERGVENEWPVTVERRVLLGDIVNYSLSWPGGTLRVHGFPGRLWAEGETAWVYISPRHIVLVDAD